MDISSVPDFQDELAAFTREAFSVYEKHGVVWDEWLRHEGSIERGVLRPLKRFSRQRPGHAFSHVWRVLSKPIKDWTPEDTDTFRIVENRYGYGYPLDSLVAYYSFDMARTPGSRVDNIRSNVHFRSIFSRSVEEVCPFGLCQFYDRTMERWFRTSYDLQQFPSIAVLNTMTQMVPTSHVSLEGLCDPL